MTTIQDIKVSIANYFEVTVADLTVNGQDMALFALNQVRRQAELNHDFEFQRKLVTVDVDGVTGGSLENAVLKSDGVTPVDIKSVIEVGLFDTTANLRPVEWTTVAESIERQRAEERFSPAHYLNDYDTQAYDTGGGIARFVVSGSDVFCFPKTTVTTPLVLGLEIYAFSSNWTAAQDTVTVTGITNPTDANGTYTILGAQNDYPIYSNYVEWSVLRPSGPYYIAQDIGYNTWSIRLGPGDSNYIALIIPNIVQNPSGSYVMLSSQNPSGTYPTTSGTWTGTAVVTLISSDTTSNVWTQYATQYLQWAAIVQLNHLFKHFVFRQEGNLPPPEKLRDEGLEAFKMWDSNRYELNRRHSR